MKSWPHYPKVCAFVEGKQVYAPQYFRWRAMMQRCYNRRHPEFKRYGARGIRVCRAWHSFWNFFKWVADTWEPGKTVDRINNDGPYTPRNCRWATPLEQQLNARITPARRRGIQIAIAARKASGYADIKNRKRTRDGRFA